jgi:DNA-binding IclR family transcriptional regulator
MGSTIAHLAVVSSNHWAPGIVAIGAPVFNARKEITLVMSVIGIDGMLDIGRKGLIAQSLQTAANRLSARLGYA